MQPLSRVKPDAITIFGNPETMTLRPNLAAKVARCVAQWGEFLGILLHANQAAALAMYSALENRAAQQRIISAAAKASVPSDHFDVISSFLSTILRPAMKERDKLAHWLWGYSDDLPDALLLAEPPSSIESLMRAITTQPGMERAAVEADYARVFVIRDPDLDGIITRSVDAKFYLRVAMSSVWDHNTPQERAQYLQQLASVPLVRSALDRLAANRNSQPKP
jgi:hypothetical protein